MDDEDIVCLSPEPEPRPVFQAAKEPQRPSAGRGRGDPLRFWRRRDEEEEQNNYNPPRPTRYFNRRSPSPGRSNSSYYGRYHDQDQGNHHEDSNDQNPYSKRPRTSPGNECGSYYQDGMETRTAATSYYNRPRIQTNHLCSHPSVVDSRPYDMSFQRPPAVFSGSTSSENDAVLPTIENGHMVRNPLFKPQSSQIRPFGYSEPITKIRRQRKSPSMLEPLYNTSRLPVHPPQSSFLSASSNNNGASNSSDLPVKESPPIRPTKSSPEVIELEGSDDEIQMILEESASSCDGGPAPNKTSSSTKVPKPTTEKQASQSVEQVCHQHAQADLQKQSNEEIDKIRRQKVLSKVSTGVQTEEETQVSSSSSSESSSSDSDDDDDDISSSDDTSTIESSDGKCDLVKDELLGVEKKDQIANGKEHEVENSQSRSVQVLEDDDEVVILEERLFPAPTVVRDGEATVKTEKCDLHENDTDSIPSVVQKEIVSQDVRKCVQVETRVTQEAIGDEMEIEILNQPEAAVQIRTEKYEARADESEAKADGMEQTEKFKAKADEMEQTDESEAEVDGTEQTEKFEARADGMEQTEESESEAKADGMEQSEMTNQIKSNEATQDTKPVRVETEKADGAESLSMEREELPQSESSITETEKVTNPEAINMETVKTEASEAVTIVEENASIPSRRKTPQISRKSFVFKPDSNTLVEANASSSCSSVSSEAGPSAKKDRLSSSAPSNNVLQNLVTGTSGDKQEHTLVRRKVLKLKAQVVEGPTGFQFEFHPSVRELVAIPMIASQIDHLQKSLPGLVDGAEVEIKVSHFKQRRRPTTDEPSTRPSTSTEASNKDCDKSVVETESPLVHPSPSQKPYPCVQTSSGEGPNSSESDSMKTHTTISAVDKETDENGGSEKSQVANEQPENPALVKVENVPNNAEDISSTHVAEATLEKTDDPSGITPDSFNDTISSLIAKNLKDKKLPPLQNFSAGRSPVNLEPTVTQVFGGSYKKIREALLKKKSTQP